LRQLEIITNQTRCLEVAQVFVARRLIAGQTSTFLRCNTNVPFYVASRRSFREANPEQFDWLRIKKKKKN